jgi:hypothetical protein
MKDKQMIANEYSHAHISSESTSIHCIAAELHMIQL